MSFWDLVTAIGQMPSWLDRANQQTQRDISAYQRGGVPALMADTGEASDLAGGFGGTTKNVGIRAYHGSPYDFDKFDLSKIGTGEGAQAYGHGLYFAENPAVAEAYKKALTGLNPNSLGSGKGQFGVNNIPMPTGISGHAALDTGQQMDLLLSTMKHNPDSTMIPYLKQQIENRIANHYSMTSGGSAGDDMRAMAEYYNTHVKNATPEQVSSIAPGKMYEVNINAHPDQFLNWDAPLSQQPVSEVLKGTHIGAYDDFGRLTGQEVVRDNLTEGQLQALGIPGIKYLDQGSRNNAFIAPNAKAIADLDAAINSLRQEGTNPKLLSVYEQKRAELNRPQTNNYVVFNPDIIDIIKKYGLAGMLGGSVLGLPQNPNNQVIGF